MKCGRTAARLELADQRAVAVLALEVEGEQVLRGDHLAFHADHLGDVGDPADAVAHALDLDDQVDRAGDLGAHRLARQVDARHADHVLHAGQRLARVVGVQRAHRAVVAGVHRLQHVERLGAAHLAADDPVRPHAQRVLDQVAHRDLAGALEVGRAGLEADHVRLLQLQLGRVLDRDHALGRVDQMRHRVQHRRLARAGAARDHDVEAAGGGDLEHLAQVLGHVALPDHDVERDRLLGELADRDRAAVDRERRRDDVDARAVGQPGVGDRAGLVDPAADPGDDPLRDVHHVRRCRGSGCRSARACPCARRRPAAGR